MPIESSRRQRPSADALSDAVVFTTHRRLARRHRWQQRLLFASGGALLGSLIGLGLSSPLWQVLSLVVGFAAGLLFKRPGSEAWALDWIEFQTGLSYRTALELSHDTYGLAQAVRTRARQALRRLTPPTWQPWWLPMLVLAVSLQFLPFLGPGWRSGTAGASPGVNTTSVTPLPPEQDAAVTPTADEPPVEPVATPPESAAEPPSITPDLTSDVDLSGPGRDTAGEGAAQNAPLDSETLSEFLERLAQEPPREAVTTPVLPQDAVQPGEAAEPTEPLPSEPTAGEQLGEGVTGTERPTDQIPNGQEQTLPGEEPTDEMAQELQPGQEPGEESGAAGEPNTEAGQELTETPNEGAGDTAGAGESVPIPVEPALGGPQQPLEFLPGQLQEGPAARAGAILLPGEEPGELPTGMPAGGFARAIEQALTEGRIPVKYQEILRNYFR